MAAGPLAHLRVIDVTDLRGALAGRMLADLGADVVKVEPPGGDPGRLAPPFAGDVVAADRSLPFLFRNLGKRGAVLDLASDEGWRRLVALCDAADVLIENVDQSMPGAERFTPEAVRARHPHLVHTTIADCGRSGPRAGWRLEPLPAFAASGALWASGFTDRAPCWLPGFQAHDCASAIAVVGALAAVTGRARHGRGATIEVSVEEAAMASFAPWGIVRSEYARRFPVLPRIHPRDADGPAIVVPVADGWVRFLAITPHQLLALGTLLAGGEPRSPDPEPRHHTAGVAQTVLAATLTGAASRGMALANLVMGAVSVLPVQADVLLPMRAAYESLRLVARYALAGRTRDDVLAHGLRLGLPIAAVNRPEEFVASAQARARGFFRSTGFAHLGAAPVAPFPGNLSASPAAIARPAPAPGEDTGDFAPSLARPASSAGADAPPLTGVRVVSLGVGAVVPELCGVLRDLGAQVIKLEDAAHPDFLRRLTLDPASPNRSFMFNDENRGQESICIDLASERGHELARRLCATADVVAENRRGGFVERLGLDYAAVRALRPDVIYVSSQGYGRGGPLGDAPAYGPLAAAFAGATWLWNHRDAPYPAGSSLEHPDHAAGRLLAVAVLAALEHRRRTGVGQHVELAQSEAAAFLLGDLYLHAPCTGRAAEARGNAAADACPHGVYRAHGDDRWIAISVPDDAAWQRFQAALGWGEEPRWASRAGRLVARPELDARVTRWTTARAAEDAAAVLQAAGVSAAAVQGPEEHRADLHLSARAAFVCLDDPEVGPVLHVANPLRHSSIPLVAPAPAPRLGEHTERVLVGVLGLTVEEVRRLAADGVVTMV